MPGHHAWAAVVVLLAAGCAAESAEQPDPQDHPASQSAHLDQPRAVHRATRLLDGSVLITGGCTTTGCGGFEAARRAELVSSAGRSRPGPRMATPRASGTATLLDDGRVLLVGGYPGEGQSPTGLAEVFDPGRGGFVRVRQLATPRADHSATLLPDGRVLVAGGFGAGGEALDSTEVFDPVSGAFTPGPRLSAQRAAHVAALSRDAVVLVGGTTGGPALASTDILRDGRWQAGPRLLTPRVKLGVANVGDRLLVVGGATDVEGRERLSTTELLDVRRSRATRGPDLPSGEYKLDGAVATLEDGRVVVPVGSTLVVLGPGDSRFTTLRVKTYQASSFRTVTPLTADRVLVAGGYDSDIRPTDELRVVQVPPT